MLKNSDDLLTVRPFGVLTKDMYMLNVLKKTEDEREILTEGGALNVCKPTDQAVVSLDYL